MPVSAQECAASASMEADDVSEAATDLAMAISRLATNATITVITLSPPASSASGSVLVSSTRGDLRSSRRPASLAA